MVALAEDLLELRTILLDHAAQPEVKRDMSDVLHNTQQQTTL
jgi:hypothetical protein